MTFAERYIQKYHFMMPQIKEPPSGLLRFMVVIPAYLEDSITNTLESLKLADQPGGDVEVIIVVNFSEDDSQENKNKNLKIFNSLQLWELNNSSTKFKYHSILADNLPEKHAGAGLARKIGMDEAIHRFNLIKKPEGLILSLDADTKVEYNYFTAVEKIMCTHNNFGGCILQFAHDLEGQEYNEHIYKAITDYELHLRYYKHILEYSGFPYSNYTIGSCFGIRADVYTSQGGMNRRQAGEDFYFLNKVFPNRAFAEVRETCVFLSPRPSKRVPFGTGPVVARLSEKEEEFYYTYTGEAFFDLEQMFRSVNDLYDLSANALKLLITDWPEALREFLIDHKFYEKLMEIKKNTSSSESFRKRFFTWFNGFKVVKYMNYAHKKYYKKVPVKQAAITFLNKTGYPYYDDDARSLLELFRKLDKEGKKLIN
ncbi:hypothetical protein ES705_05568 [subsurface metagenome]